MKGYVSILKDRIGNEYLGVKIQTHDITDYLDEFDKLNIWENLKHEADYLSIFKDNKFKRDGNEYHMTILPVMEITNIQKNLEYFSYKSYDISLKGIGSATNNNNKAYFIVCECEELNNMILKLGKPKKDFHITLGFNKKDVHGVDKSIKTLL